MADKSKKLNEGYASEEGMCSLLKRYPVNTVFALQQEVSQVAGEKIDWHEMVKHTATGISSAREYQMLWLHLAYCQTLDDKIDRDQEPMVLIDSGRSNDSHLSNRSTIDAPYSITLSNNKAFTIPVSLQKVSSSSGLAGIKRPFKEITGVNVQTKRKRRGWSMEEDLKLTAAASKNIDLNWDNIARVEFNDARRANELSQRWATLKKKQVGTNSQQHDTLAAANRAIYLAIDMPMGVKAASSGAPKSQKPRKPCADQTLGRSVPTKPPAQIDIKAAAIAARARIATSAEASALLEAARSYKVVHFTTRGGGSSSMRPTSQLPSNVHFIRNGLQKASISTYSAKPVVRIGSTTVQKSAVVSKEVIKQGQVAARGNSSGSTLAELLYGRKVEMHVKPAIRAEDDQLPLPSSHVKDNGKKNAESGPGSKVIDENKGGESGSPVVRTGSTTVQKSAVVSKEVIKQGQVAARGNLSGSTLAELLYGRKVERHVKPAIRAEGDKLPLPSSHVKDNGKKNADSGPGSNVIDENKSGESGLPETENIM